MIKVLKLDHKIGLTAHKDKLPTIWVEAGTEIAVKVMKEPVRSGNLILGGCLNVVGLSTAGFNLRMSCLKSQLRKPTLMERFTILRILCHV